MNNAIMTWPGCGCALVRKPELKDVTKTEWLSRCAARFQQRGCMELNEAMKVAEASLENLDNDLTENPEDAADEDLTRWQD